MKTKSLMMLAMSGLIAASLAHIAPAMAEEDAMNVNGSDPLQIAAADNTQNGNASQNEANASGAASSDEASPDTATGDDDY